MLNTYYLYGSPVLFLALFLYTLWRENDELLVCDVFWGLVVACIPVLNLFFAVMCLSQLSNGVWLQVIIKRSNSNEN